MGAAGLCLQPGDTRVSGKPPGGFILPTRTTRRGESTLCSFFTLTTISTCGTPRCSDLSVYLFIASLSLQRFLHSSTNTFVLLGSLINITKESDSWKANTKRYREHTDEFLFDV